jgi:hypothetical protein
MGRHAQRSVTHADDQKGQYNSRWNTSRAYPGCPGSIWYTTALNNLNLFKMTEQTVLDRHVDLADSIYKYHLSLPEASAVDRVEAWSMAYETIKLELAEKQTGMLKEIVQYISDLSVKP